MDAQPQQPPPQAVGLEVSPSTCFVDPRWLTHFGGARPDNALAYFERSPFFERGDGIEFHIEPEMGDPRCIVICRRRRRDGREAEVEAYYYVLEGTIYQCPRADDLVRSHVRKAGFYVTQAYEAMEALCKQQEKEEREALERQPPPELPMWVPPKNPDFPEDPDLVRWVRSRIPGHP
mmetsp:Transcript_17157/g.51212  ORF Transcript_17157/g.51212 Transcript_17157/m.51212 type:complete len:177 (-) Transcript_17157:29-559(-)